MTVQVKKFPSLQQMHETIQTSSLPDQEKRIASAYAVIFADRPLPIDHYNAMFARMALVDLGEDGWPIPPEKRSKSLHLIADVFSSVTPVSDPVQEVSRSLFTQSPPSTPVRFRPSPPSSTRGSVRPHSLLSPDVQRGLS